MTDSPIYLTAIDDIEPDVVPYAFSWSASLLSAFVFVLCAGLLIVAASLTPDASGVGTHSQLGMSSCGFLDRTGLPCATCGMTTSFALAAHGHVLGAFVNQPAGALLALMTAIIAILSGYATLKGLSMVPLFLTLLRPKVIMVFAGVVLASWVFKIFTLQGI